jgi:mannose-6-phosphate isomerase
VHPSKAAAEKEFARENAAGIPTDAPNRNYRDDNHKPELVLALSGFWLLHGFKSPANLKETLQQVKELQHLLPFFEEGSYAGLYKKVMEMPQGEVNRMLRPLLDRILPLYHEDKLEKSEEDFWAARAALIYSQDHSIDRGIFSIYLFNLLRIEKGEAVYQDAGIPHAYLEGQNVEIMSNSDNVLRGGLTNKHVDVGELLKHVKFEATPFDILSGEKKSNGEIVFHTTAPDFELGCFDMGAGQQNSFQSVTAEILLLTEGEVEISCAEERISLQPGQPAALVLPGNIVTLRAIQKALVFRATVPVHTRE